MDDNQREALRAKWQAERLQMAERMRRQREAFHSVQAELTSPLAEMDQHTAPINKNAKAVLRKPRGKHLPGWDNPPPTSPSRHHTMTETKNEWLNSTMTTYQADGVFTDPCQVKFNGSIMSVSYTNDDDGGTETYEGLEESPGHFNLIRRAGDGAATLHRIPGDDKLDGSWVEDGYEGMWRIVEDTARLTANHQPAPKGHHTPPACACPARRAAPVYAPGSERVALRLAAVARKRTATAPNFTAKWSTT
jgi:hypothetical protein